MKYATSGFIHRTKTDVTEQLTLLLDLKQKQANASEARSSRMQAEQALKQANETARQGTSIMLVRTLSFHPTLTRKPFFC